MFEESDSSQTSNEQTELERRGKGHAVLALCYSRFSSVRSANIFPG